jgi:hypothetical protein
MPQGLLEALHPLLELAAVPHDLLGRAGRGHAGARLAAATPAALREAFAELGKALQGAASRTTTESTPATEPSASATQAGSTPANQAATRPATQAGSASATQAGSAAATTQAGSASATQAGATTTLAFALGQEFLQALATVALAPRTLAEVSRHPDRVSRDLAPTLLALAAQGLEALFALL